MLLKAPLVRFKKTPIQNRRKSTKVFMDKIVNGKDEPLLYNVESARLSMETSTGPYTNIRQMRGPKCFIENRRNVIAEQTLAKMNITVSQHTENFSLLQDNSDKPSLSNVNIMDVEDFKNTVNKEITVQDKFPYDNDPFYQLDDSVRAPSAYTMPKVIGSGKIAKVPDLSYILSQLTIINQKRDYHGKNKYY